MTVQRFSAVCLIFVLLHIYEGEGVRYHVTTYTCNENLAGTSAKIQVKFHGEYGYSGWHRIHGSFGQDDTAHTDIYARDVGPITSVQVKHDNSGAFPGWKLEKFEVSKGSERYRFPCSCWVKKNDVKKAYAAYSCNGKGTGIYACNYHGTCQPYGRCTCDTGAYMQGSTCYKCPDIKYCEKQKPCSSKYDMLCYQCEGKNSTIEYSLSWPTDTRTCTATCSWNKRWCWPGNCSDHLHSSCKCRKGFKKVEGADMTTCELSALPDLTTCNIIIEDQHGQRVRSTPGKSTGCDYESSTYSNIQPNKMLNFSLFATFANKTNHSPPFPIYIDSEGTNTGIVSGIARVFVEFVNGLQRAIQTIPLDGGGDCNHTINSESPSDKMDCHFSLDMNQHLQNGERLCTQFVVQSGGFFHYFDFGMKPLGTKLFTPQPKRKILCLNFDNAKPKHCLSNKLASCTWPVMYMKKRITKTGNISIRIGDGWNDPWPKAGSSKHASGIKLFNLEVHFVKTKATLLEVDKGSLNPPIKEELLYNATQQVLFRFPKGPALYCIMLEVHDNANNVKFARRFVLFDNTSKIEIDNSKPLTVVSASNVTNYKWQVTHGLICLDWKDRYYNSYYIHNNLLAPIKPDTGNDITGIYDQQTGKLPISGTKSINGLTDFIYVYSLNKGTYSIAKSVPNFQNQSICFNFTLSDGDTYTFGITAEDVMENRLREYVTMHIDRSVPDVNNIWLVRNNNNKLYVHHSVDLSHMVLQFEASDPHSGIHSMQWFLGTQRNTSDIGSGALPVLKLPTNKSCGADQQTYPNCYCPAVGPCAYLNYTVTLNSLVHNGTHVGKHNREYYFSLIATNTALLKSIYHLDILVDDSPPVAGVVHEGSPDGPDIDYTSEDYVSINMHGFIDHESDIRFYLVALAERCLTLQEMNNIKNTNTFNIYKTVNSMIKVAFPNSGLFFSTVVAYNNAMEPSNVVCSDGVTKDTTSALITNIILRNGKMQQGLWCQKNKAWYLNQNMSLVKMQLTDTCQKKCEHHQNTGYVDSLPRQEKVITDNDTSDYLCSTLSPLTNEPVVYLPSDKIYLTWKTNETESQIRDYLIGIGDDRSQTDAPSLLSYESTHAKESFQIPHSGFTGGSLFYIFLKSINKAGLSSSVILGPIMIDETPPQLSEKLYPKINKNKVLVTWTNQSIKDPEQNVDEFTVLYRVAVHGKYLSSIIQTPESIRQKCKKNGFQGCIQYPLKALQEYDSEQDLPFYFELHIYNLAGHVTLANTEPIHLPSRFPPGNAVVFDIDPLNQRNIEDIDYHNASQQACVFWEGFSHHHNVTFYVGIGKKPQLDDVFTFVKADHKQSCFNSSALKPNIKYFSSVKAESSGGTEVSSSDGFIIIDDKTTEYTVDVYDGIGCHSDSTPIVRIYPLMENNQLHGFKIKGLVIGIEHTLFITNTQLNGNGTMLFSDDAIIIKYYGRNSHCLSFVPTVSDPVLFLNNTVFTSMTKHGYVMQCTNDIDFQHSIFQYSMHWNTNEFINKHATHFIISLEQSTCRNLSNPCLTEITSSVVHASDTNYTWNELFLTKPNLIKGYVQPCFDDLCLERKSSDGVFVVNKPLIISLNAKISTEGSNCTQLSITMDAQCDAGDDSRIFHWYIAKQPHGHQQLTPMKTIRGQSFGSIKENTCINISVHSYQHLLICTRVYCSSEFSQISCSSITLMEDVHNYKTYMLYDIDIKDVSFERASNLVKSKYLDRDSMRFLHENDINFATSDTLIGGVLTNTANRNVTWYLMTKKSLPQDCSTDKNCISNLHTVGGVVNFRKTYLRNHLFYYICAHVPESVVNREFSKEKLDSFAGCSNGFVVDDDAPEPGTVEIIGHTSGFITDQTTLSIAWRGFTDVEKYIDIPLQSGIAGYYCALGTIPNSEDIVPFRSVGMMTTGHLWNLTLTNGEVYYATVKATDHLRHTTTAVSQGVVVDTTPPTPGSVVIEGLLFHQHVLPRRAFRIMWNGFEDIESGISKVRLSVRSSRTNYNIITDYEDNLADIEDVGFVDGHTYHVKFEVINGAGLTSVQQTTDFMIDASPPDIGIVSDGHESEKYDVDYQENTTTYHCHWSGFKDAHSGIASYRVGLGSNPYNADVRPLVLVGLRSNFTWTMPFSSGKKYFVIVEACNNANLCSKTSSDGLIMDNTAPLIGQVFVGQSEIHENYQGHASSIMGHWHGFEDPETGIVQFEWCLGSEPYVCNITHFENIQLADSLIKSNLKLPISVPLYLTIKAINRVGLQSVSTSDGFIVDDTVPIVIDIPYFISPDFFQKQNISVQTDISLINVSWKFEDLESPIIKHILTLKTHNKSHASLERKEIGAETSHILTFNKDNRLRNGDVYSLSVTACNQAGLCATTKSHDLLIDSTPPHLGGFKMPFTWQNVLHKNITLTMLNLTWYGFSEHESQITEYQIQVSRSYDGSELSGGIIHVFPKGDDQELSNSILLTDELQNGEPIIASIRALNSVGLITKSNKVTVSVITSDFGKNKGFLQVQRHSCDIHYCTKDCTCAIVGRTCPIDQTVASCVNVHNAVNVTKYPEIKITNHLRPVKERHYTVSTSCLAIHWESVENNSLINIQRFEWSMGLKGQPVGSGIYDLIRDKIWHSTGKRQDVTYCLPPGKSLHNGKEYVVYIRVWYSFTEFKQFESSPVMVDSTAPAIRQGKQVKDSDETCQTDFDFVTRSSFITACWGGVFQDSQSGIDSYSIQVGSTPYGSDVMEELQMGIVTNYSLASDMLTAGRKYFVTVKAVNKAGLYTVAFSDGFVIDDEPPVAGVVFNTAEHVNHVAQSSLTSFEVSWRGFQDHHSAVVNYKVAVYKLTDVPMKVYHVDAGFKNHVVLNNLSFVQGERYQASVTAVDVAGLASATVMSPPMLIDSTPPIGFECSNLSKIVLNTTRILAENKVKITFHVHQKTFFKILVSKSTQAKQSVSKMKIFFKVAETFIPTYFKAKDNATSIEANYYFLSPKTESQDVEILSDVDEKLSDLDISVFSCDEIQQVDGFKALTVQQIMPSLVYICARIFDPEHDLLKINIGVGTTKGGFQLRPLTPTFLHFNEKIEVDVPHGTPVYVTATAENIAGLISVFSSKSLLIDHTPPLISWATATLVYSSGGSNDVAVMADLKWNVHDEESGVKSCWCGLGNNRYSENLQPWTMANQVTRCKLNIPNPYQHEEIHVTVKCFNHIDLHSSICVGPKVVLLKPPSSEEGKLVFLIKNKSPDFKPIVQVQSNMKHLQFFWHNFADYHYTKTFNYRITSGGFPITEWMNTSYNYAEVSANLQTGVEYTAEVIAVDARDQKGVAITRSVIVDDRPPTLKGVGLDTHWEENAVSLEWRKVFFHPRSTLMYNIFIGSRSGYTDLLRERNTHLTNAHVDLPSSINALNVIIKATADNGKFVIYTAHIRK